MGDHKVSDNFCEKCQEEFENHAHFKSHTERLHSKQWNCDKCAFQASTRKELMNHCRLTKGHQPSKQQRLGQSGILRCYTCLSEFRTYHDLMNHRKEDHPSHKQCRYYLKGECMFSRDECWYLHEDTTQTKRVDTDKSENCFICGTNFNSKYDLTEHKKKNHKNKAPCKEFEKGICEKSAEQCWNEHIPIKSHETITSTRPNSWEIPLSTVQQQDFQHIQSQVPPDQTQLMMVLNMLNQKMETIQSMSQRLLAIEKKISEKQI